MITQKKANVWLIPVSSSFSFFLPDCPTISITVSSNKTFEQRRNRIVERTGCPIKEVPAEYSCMEYLHGPKGGGIIINCDAVPPGTDYDLFSHLLWHELGHFYAINKDPNNLERYNDAPWTDENKNIKRGYWFWAEFVAEALSNYVSFRVRSDGGYYHPEMITWEADIWIPVSDKVEDNLDLIYGNGRIDEYELAHYFATLLMDDAVKLYVEAANEGKLIGYDGEPADEEPTYISKLDERLQKPLWELKKILDVQIAKEFFWLTDEETMEKIGKLIFQMDDALKEIDDEIEEEWEE